MRRTLWLLVCCLLALPASAQLARSYYNVTGVSARKLSNAIQITIQTDGNVAFDVETQNLFEFKSVAGSFQLIQKSSFEIRIRLNGARSKIPTFNEIATYPADSAIVGLGNQPLQQPYSRFQGSGEFLDPTAPRVDVLLRFYAPVRVGYGSIKLGNQNFESGYQESLRPLDVKIELTPDRRAIQLTVLLDRVEADRGAEALKRSPVAEHHHALSVSGTAESLTVAALHTPLSEVLEQVSQLTQTPLAVQPDATEADISLSLPHTTLSGFLRVLELGYGLATRERTLDEGSGYLVGRSGGTLVTEQLVLKNLAPAVARTLLPDFLLPLIRADEANNALVVTASPELVRRIRADLGKLDTPRQQVRIVLTAYELTQTPAVREALAIATDNLSLVPESAQLALQLQPSQAKKLMTTLSALESKGVLRLTAKPSLVVASGATGTLYAGQERFVSVTINGDFGQQSQALKLPIGTELRVTPQVGEGGEITLRLLPRFTTVDSLEAKTGLPTLGIRTFDSTLRLKPGETALIGSLESDTDSKNTRPGRRAREAQKTSLLLFVTATTEIKP